MLNDLGLIFYVYVLGLVLQLTVGGVVLLKTKHVLVDGGWAAGRIVGWLVIGLLVWFLGYLKLPINTYLGVNIIGLLVVGVAGAVVVKEKRILRKELLSKWQLILVEELLFLLGLFGMSLIRGFNPQILDLEKFMDVGFMNSYLRSSTLPANDMWLAGEKINYYSFGHFLGAVMSRLWQLKTSYAYNLILGWLMGMVLPMTFSLIVNIGRATRRIGKITYTEIAGGLFGSLLVTLGGNSQTMWFFLKHRTWLGYWYADATRFIPNTIHEFPAYSFVVSDLHGHVWDLPIVLLFLLLLIGWSKVTIRKWRWAGLLGVAMGVMIMTNTWDFLVYGLLALIFSAGLLIMKKISIRELLESGVCAALMMVLVAAPWAIGFESIGEGVRLVTTRSTIRDLMILWTGHVFLSSVAMVMGLQKKNWLVVTLVLTAFILILIPELVYVKDIYPSHPRANTMFKLTYQAFILMSLAIGVLVTMLERMETKLVIGSLVLIGTGAFLSFPAFGFPGYYGEFKQYQGLDGEKWLATRYPDDYQGIEWLRAHALEGEVILEAVGESYTDFDRVSTFTGLPTVLGWRVHEWLWRGGFEIPGQRTEEVKQMFTEPVNSQPLFERYQVSYVFVGAKEKEIYEVNERELLQLGEIVFESGETKIVRLNDRLVIPSEVEESLLIL